MVLGGFMMFGLQTGCNRLYHGFLINGVQSNETNKQIENGLTVTKGRLSKVLSSQLSIRRNSSSSLESLSLDGDVVGSGKDLSTFVNKTGRSQGELYGSALFRRQVEANNAARDEPRVNTIDTKRKDKEGDLYRNALFQNQVKIHTKNKEGGAL